MMRLMLAASVVALSAATVSAAPAGPPLLVIRQIVADYATWRPAYDAHKPARDDAGLANCRVRSTVDNPNEVFVACDVSDVAKARAFTTSQGLADAMKRAGVVGKPDFYILAPER